MALPFPPSLRATLRHAQGPPPPAEDTLQKNLELYMTFKLQRRMTIFFDLATYYLTRGHEEK